MKGGKLTPMLLASLGKDRSGIHGNQLSMTMMRRMTTMAMVMVTVTTSLLLLVASPSIDIWKRKTALQLAHWISSYLAIRLNSAG